MFIAIIAVAIALGMVHGRVTTPKAVAFVALVALAISGLIGAWVKQDNDARAIRFSRAARETERDLFVATACLSIETEPAKWRELGNIRRLSPCDGDADAYREEISEAEDSLRAISQSLKTTETGIVVRALAWTPWR